MYRPSVIKTELAGIIGWRQNYDVATLSIASSLTDSSSGMYFQDFHPLMTLENMKATAPDFTRITHATWLVGTQYYKADRVTLDSVEYRAKIDNIGASPDSSPTEWEIFDPFSEWVEQKTEASILKVIRSFWDEKMSAGRAKNLLESRPLFDGAGRLADTIADGVDVVGFELIPIRAKGVTTRIDKIGMQFTGAGAITVSLFHSSRKTPIKTQVLTRTRDSGMEWFTLVGFELPFLSDENDFGGSWYLVYDQALLSEGVNAVNKEKDWSAAPCSGCSNNEASTHKILSRYLEIHPFKAGEVGASELWDIEDNLYTQSSNYGMNLQLTVSCDITDMIVTEKTAFQNAIGLQVACDMLREFAYNPNFRINRDNVNYGTAEILYELDGDSQSYKKSGLLLDYRKAMEAIDIDMTKMSRVCLPCNNRGVKHKTT